MTIENGLQVSMNYKLTVDGEVIDQSAEGSPLSYIQGSGMIIPGLDESMLGLKVGDKKSVTVAPEKGYGQVILDAIQTVPKDAIQGGGELKPGMVLQGQSEGRPIRAKVTAVADNEVTLDMNHPLAGKTLEFEVEVVGVDEAPKDAGQGHQCGCGDGGCGS